MTVDRSPLVRYAPWAALCLCLALCVAPAWAQMVTGRGIPEFDDTMGLSKGRESTTYDVRFVNSTVRANILWPGEQGQFTFELTNTLPRPMRVVGTVQVIAYGTKGRPDDIWVPQMFKVGDITTVPISVNIPAQGKQQVTIAPAIPERFGAYAMIFDLGKEGRRFGLSVVRTFKADTTPVLFPKLGCDMHNVDALYKLGCKSIRSELGYRPTTDPGFKRWLDEEYGARMKEYKDNNVMVIAECYIQDPGPMTHFRSHLNDKDFGPMTYPGDTAALPSVDADYEEFCYQIASKYGYPKGPINAFKIWNEPWEGSSISGWGADMLRFRELTRAMARGIMRARKDAGVTVLLGGCDSSSNTFDKFFPDGSNEFLDYLDFVSIHYQGMHPPSTVKSWVDRKSPYGRVKIWDTESWVANCDDRVAAVMAANGSTGHDRAVGVYGGNIYGWPNAWSVAASVGAAQHFLGERNFKELMFKNGLPWVMIFEGNTNAKGQVNAEDGTVVIVGDLGEEFGHNNVMFRTVRGLRDNARREEIARKLAALPAAATAEERQKLTDQLNQVVTRSGVTMTLKADPRYSLYDFYGNKVAAQRGKIIIPLDGRGFFLRGNGKPGSFAALLRAIKGGYIAGLEPLEIVCLDMLKPVTQEPTVKLKLTNVLNRPVKGTLYLAAQGLAFATPARTISLAANETKVIDCPVVRGIENPQNLYPLRLTFDAGKDGMAKHEEDVRVNLIAKRRITVDGKLDDWAGVLPQVVSMHGKAGPTMTEAAWLPFKEFDRSMKTGLASGYLAYDRDNFYFAAKIADTTVDPGMHRYATRNDDEYFYPQVSYTKPGGGGQFSVRWTGALVPKSSGAYVLHTVSDDGVRLWIDDQLLIDNWTDHGPTDDKAAIELKAGQRYAVRMEFFQSGGGATAKLLWEGDKMLLAPIPTDCLYPTGGAQTPGGLTGEYFAGPRLSGDVKLSRVDKQVNFEWANNTLPDPKVEGGELEALHWPEGVRRFSYRKDPDLPAGNAPSHDNVQIAFNVLSPEEKWWYPCPPGTMPGYIGYICTDYEYALNPVAQKYGGGTEIWRLQVPGMPHKHFYPRQPKSPFDGPVEQGRLAITRTENTRVQEVAIPWSEIPHVKKALDEGKTIKFSFRVNDNDGYGMELTKGRSVAKCNGSFTVDWDEHWANEVQFAFEK